MKVLFAVNNESISEAIVKKYQKQYKEILSYKNVYYFKAILQEIQKDKTYDRIVISEDLEPFSNNNYEAIDKFIFEKLDDISDEAQDIDGNDTSIILICGDRRTKGDSFLVKIFGIGIYNALLGSDRKFDMVCQLINKPRSKKEAKSYYKIDSDDVNYSNKNEIEVKEIEIQNIRNHFKKLGKNTDKYSESFNNIAVQYTDEQLKIIINCLPDNVKMVLEDECKVYQDLVSVNGVVQKVKVTNKENEIKKQTGIKINDILENNGLQNRISGPIVIPSSIKKGNIKKSNITEEKEISNNFTISKKKVSELEDMNNNEQEYKIVKKKKTMPDGTVKIVKVKVPIKKEEVVEPPIVEKNDEEDNEEVFVLPGFEKKSKKQESTPLEEIEEKFEQEEEYTDEVVLPGLDDLDDFDSKELDDNFDDSILPNSDDSLDTDDLLSNITSDESDFQSDNNEAQSIKPKIDYSMSSLNSLLTKDKKIATFIGTTKNGTSFLVNNLATLFAATGVNTAILDMTKNKNSYYIYTNNEEELRKTAYNSISKLQKGFAEGIKVGRNLTVYTSLPNDGKDYSDAESILSTLVQNHSLVLIDCDFDTDPSYFASCQEIYLVQSMDILTIQPLTAFLRELKAKGVLESEKVRVVINKELKVRSLTTKDIIGGMSFYNDPSMSFMTELFNKNMVKACSIPFEDNVYATYLDSMANCNISINKYTKSFIGKLKNLGEMIYPLNGKSNYSNANYGSANFSNGTGKMKKGKK